MAKERYKYVADVVLELDAKLKKKDVRDFLVHAIERYNAVRIEGDPKGAKVLKVRVRTVDLD